MKMARPKKTTAKAKRNAELAPTSDPRAPLDGAAFLKAAQRVLRLLADDLAKRATASPAVTATLKTRHAAEVEARRTADAFVVWQQSFVEQVAAAWVLSCVFARVLEDRGLLGRARIAGPGATDSQHMFLELAPSLTERDYLLTVFRELSRFAAARDLFDARHNPVWLLAPSAEVTKELLALFRTPNANEPAFRFGASDTRFLGDLYQDLSEDVKKRFALLQTPRFVESFILDRTLERAIERFGLNETTLIDPTCGSGHFLLGAFERLFDHRLRAEPGLEPREAARKALDAVFGADINPYAVAIARFRVTLAYLEKAGFTRLKDAPALPLHLVVADSLLHNPHIRGDGNVAAQKTFGDLDGQSRATWDSDLYQLEDEAAARDVLHRQYAAVVGNPPYITVKDAARRKMYAEMYDACAMNYALTVPFGQRFFQLARERGAVGMITANSFMKREFGKKLIESHFRTVNLELVVNTSGAYIPGHGTPTVLLFGTTEPPQGKTVHTVLASRGEPSTPEDPEQGLVWRSIADHWSEAGFENDYISVMQVERSSLARHPWSLGGGGASELKEVLEERADKRLGGVVEDIGFSVIIGEDEVFLRPAGIRASAHLPAIPIVIGENIRDWALTTDEVMIRPFDPATLEVVKEPGVLQELWPWRTVLANRVVSGSTTMAQSNRAWYDVRRLSRDKHRTPLSITFAFVATHNHFVLDRGGKVFNRSAPIIKLPESATEDDHYALLAYLNSSTACFWMKQVIHKKSSASQKHHTDPARAAYEFAGTALEDLPIPPIEPGSRAALISRELTDTCALRAHWLSGGHLKTQAPSIRWNRDGLREYFDAGWGRYDLTTRRAAYLQEELDWMFYAAFALVESEPGPHEGEAALGARPFEHETGYHDGVSDRARASDAASPAAREMPDHWKTRTRLLADDQLRIIETPEFKRMWRDTERNVDQAEFRRAAEREWIQRYLVELLEAQLERCSAPHRVDTLIDELTDRGHVEGAAEFLGEAPDALIRRLMLDDAVSFLAALCFTDSGVAKHAIWEEAWGLQRREDAGEHVGAIPVPPRYDQKDYRDASYWRLRGKLDVPKERFISYPGCESNEDHEPVYGWAGWNHLQRAQALAALYQDRKQREGWSKDRLTPMLAGLLELIPWIKQWHNEPSQEFEGLRLGDYFQSYLEGECRELGLTLQELGVWRPAARSKATPRNRRRGAVT